MRKLLYFLCAALLLCTACEKKQPEWVSYRATINGTVSGEGVAEALAIQQVMNGELDKVLTGKNYELYPDTPENDAAAIAACDQIYAKAGHGASSPFTILLNKSYPSSDPDNIKTVTLKTYQFTAPE